jgi:hypothetical protein
MGLMHVRNRVLDEEDNFVSLSFYLLSDLSDKEQKVNHLNTLFKREICLQEAVFCNMIETIQCSVICVDSLHLGKQDNACSQDANM